MFCGSEIIQTLLALLLYHSTHTNTDRFGRCFMNSLQSASLFTSYLWINHLLSLYHSPSHTQPQIHGARGFKLTLDALSLIACQLGPRQVWRHSSLWTHSINYIEYKVLNKKSRDHHHCNILKKYNFIDVENFLFTIPAVAVPEVLLLGVTGYCRSERQPLVNPLSLLK